MKAHGLGCANCGEPYSDPTGISCLGKSRWTKPMREEKNMANEDVVLWGKV